MCSYLSYLYNDISNLSELLWSPFVGVHLSDILKPLSQFFPTYVRFQQSLQKKITWLFHDIFLIFDACSSLCSNGAFATFCINCRWKSKPMLNFLTSPKKALHMVKFGDKIVIILWLQNSMNFMTVLFLHPLYDHRTLKYIVIQTQEGVY